MVAKKSPHSDTFIVRTESGLFCPRANLYIDPWRPVDRALITHAHADHARAGSQRYHTAMPGVGLLKKRLGTDQISGHPYGEVIHFGEIAVSFHPAGHVLGSSQVRLTDGQQTWVISGDYKRAEDPTCAVFEPVECDVLITEATFALPIYRWPAVDVVMAELFRWWDRHVQAQRTPVLLCYSLGKAQRIMAEILQRSDRSVWVHSAIASLNPCYADQGIRLCPWRPLSEAPKGPLRDLVIAPPQAQDAALIKRHGPVELAMASGWMQIRGVRRRAAISQGFVISDHADWPGLIQTIRQSKAARVYATHGETRILSRYLNEVLGIAADRLETAFGLDTDHDQ